MTRKTVQEMKQSFLQKQYSKHEIEDMIEMQEDLSDEGISLKDLPEDEIKKMIQDKYSDANYHYDVCNRLESQAGALQNYLDFIQLQT